MNYESLREHVEMAQYIGKGLTDEELLCNKLRVGVRNQQFKENQETGECSFLGKIGRHKKTLQHFSFFRV